MTDIVERLDDFSKCYAELSGTTDEVLMSVEAATEIRQLRADNARLRDIIDGTLSSRDWAYAKSKGYDALAETESDDD